MQESVLDSATSAAWFQAFMRHSPAAAAVRDAKGLHCWVNPTLLQMLDLREEQVLGRNWAEFQPEEAAAQQVAVDRRVLDSEAPLRWRLPLHRSDGDGELTGFSFPVELPGGEPGVGSAFIDVSETRRLRERLAVSERLYRGLFERSGVPLAIFGLDQLVRDANPAYCRMLRYRPDEIRGLHVRRLITRATAVASGERWLAVVAGELDHYRTISTGVRKDGSTITGQTIVSLVRDASGAPEMIYAMSDPAILATEDAPEELTDHARFELTAREIAVLEGVAEGRSSRQLARTLGMSQKGVDYHVRKLGELLGVSNRTGMVARAYALGVLVAGVWPPRAAAYAAEWQRRPTI